MANSTKQPQGKKEAKPVPKLDFLEREHRLLRLIDNAKLGMVIIDQTHRVLEANQRFADMLEYTRKEVLGLFTWDFEAYTSKSEIEETYSDLSQIDFSIETTHRRKDGSLFDVEVSGVGVNLGNAPNDNAILCFCQDISERKKAERKLLESEKKFKSFVENAADIVFTVNTRGEVEYMSPNSEKIIGYKPDMLSGKQLFDLLEDDSRISLLTDIQAAFKGDSLPKYEYRLLNSDNCLEWYSIRFSVTDDVISGKPLLICNARNINERKRNEEKLEHLSMHDQLTGIYNRLFFYEQLQRMDQQSVYPLSVLTFDLDGLKYINDHYGHLTGDEVLVWCTRLVGAALRKNDVFARVGGDEFSIILPMTAEDEAKVLALRITETVRQANDQSGLPQVNFSLGIATKAEPTLPLRDVLTKADKRMYQEKRIKKADGLGVYGQSQAR